MHSNDHTLRCSCANGHQVRASEKLAGRSVPCPACGVLIQVPQSAPSSISDTGAVRILNDLESECQANQQPQQFAQPDRVEAVPRPERTCPRCECEIVKSDHVCPECKLILASGNRAFQRVYRAALRALK